MSRDEQVFALIEEITGEPAVRRDLDVALFELQLLDSLRTVMLLAALNERIGTDISLSEIDRAEWATPRRVASFVDRWIAERRVAT